MRIMQINEICGTGSIGRTTYELAEELTNQGHQCLVAYANGNSSFENSVRIGNYLDHKIHALMSRITGLQGYFSVYATKNLLKEIKKFDPQVVHLRNLHGNYINLRLLLKYLSKNDIATVVTLHDCWVYTGKCTYYVPVECDKWQKNCGKCPLLHVDNVNPTYFFDRTRKCLKDKREWFGKIPRLAVTGVSKWVASEAEKSIFSKKEIRTIYNWIDTEVFSYRQSGLKEKLNIQDKKVVLMLAASLSVKKGYNELLYLSKNLSPDYKLIFIGKNELQLDIPDNVIYISHTDDAIELAEYYSMADVCVNVTQYETFGKVTAEAICCGTPAVVYNNTASPELVDEGCGIVIDQSEGMRKIVDAIHEITGNGKEYYKENCQKSAENRFKKSIGVNKYIELYESLINMR